MDNVRYKYYLHGTSVESPEEIADFFNNGLIDYYGTHMASTMTCIDKDLERESLDSLMKTYVQGEFKTVFLIKVPEDFMGVRHRDGRIYTPLPLFKDSDEVGYEHKNIFVFTPHLIQGLYNKTTNAFITNPNYTPVFDPSGLKYAEDQIQNQRALDNEEMYQYMIERNKHSYETIYKNDKQYKTFDAWVEYYKKRFNAQVPSLFNPEEYRKLLEAQIQGNKPGSR